MRKLSNVLAILALALGGLGIRAAGAESGHELAQLVQTITGEAVPQKHNSSQDCSGDMVKIVDVKIGGKFLFVNTYYSSTLCVFERDPATAKLTFLHSFENPYKARWHWGSLSTLQPADGGLVLYYAYKGTLHWYNVDPATGVCTEAGKLAGCGDGALVFTPDKKRLFTQNAVLALDGKGTPSIERQRKSPAVALVFSPDGRHLYEATHASIAVFAYDAKAGTTTELSKLDLTGQASAPKPGTTNLSISPDGRHLYAGQVSVGYGKAKKWYSWLLERQPESGALTVKTSGEPPRDLTNAERCQFSADGTLGCFVQADPVDGEGYRSCAAWFARDPATGVLTFKGKGPAARTCCMDFDPVHGNFYAGSCGQNAKNSHVFVVKTPASTAKP